jgi:hypothetical protein
MLNLAKTLAAFYTKENIIGCRSGLCKKISPLFITREDFFPVMSCFTLYSLVTIAKCSSVLRIRKYLLTEVPVDRASKTILVRSH